MKSSSKSTLITVGKILKPRGVGPWLKVLPLTYDPGRFKFLHRVFIEKDGRSIPKGIEEISLAGRYVFVRLEGVESRDEAELYRGCEVKIPASESPELPENTYYHYQIIGMEVFTEEGDRLGEITEIIETGGNDVYVVGHGDSEVLLPAVAEVILDVDTEKNRMTIRPMKGMLDEI